MIPTGALIPLDMLAEGPTLGAILGPIGAWLVVAVVAAFAVLIVAMIRQPDARGIVRQITEARRGAPATTDSRRRPAA